MGYKLVGLRMKFKNKSQSFLSLDGKVIIYSTNLKLWDGGKVLTLRSEIRPYTSTLFMMLLMIWLLFQRDQLMPFRMPVSQNLKIKGVGSVICGRIEQGTLKPGQEVKFMPTHTAANAC